MKALISANIANLDSFLLTMPYSIEGDYVCHNSWPNKYWQSGFSATSEPTLSQLGKKVWLSIDDIKTEQFTRSHLTLMNLKLDTMLTASLSPRVALETDFTRWAFACGLGFDYELDANVVKILAENVNNTLLSLKVGQDIAVTAILHKTGDTIGLHQMTTLPAFRAQGLAKEMMQHLIAYAKQSGAHFFSLQASQAGLPLYEKFGFEAGIPLYMYRKKD
jgi:GNAT superfamily N-acetyltransferase